MTVSRLRPALVVWILALLVIVASGWVLLPFPRRPTGWELIVWTIVFGLGFTSVGALLVDRRPREPVSRITLIIGLLVVAAVGLRALAVALDARPGKLAACRCPCSDHRTTPAAPGRRDRRRVPPRALSERPGGRPADGCRQPPVRADGRMHRDRDAQGRSQPTSAGLPARRTRWASHSSMRPLRGTCRSSEASPTWSAWV